MARIHHASPAQNLLSFDILISRGRERQAGLNLFTALHVFLYRASGGWIGGTFRGAPVLLLTTVGRKTGKPRTTPLLYVRDGWKFAIVASNGGRDAAPSWWRNLKSDPRATVQIKGEKEMVVARWTTPAEKERLWPSLSVMYPPYNEYQKKTKREIPVVLLEPKNPAQ